MAEKFKIKKGDQVVVLTGKDKGKSGEVVRVIRDERRVVVSGVNVVKRHVRPSRVSAGGIEEREAPIDISNVAIRDPKTGKPTRVGFKVAADGTKQRVAKRSGEVLDK